MAYQTGTASSPINLLQTIVTWLVSIGWTQDASAADGSGWRAHLHKGAVYVNLRADMNETGTVIWGGGMQTNGFGLHMYLGTGYSGASAWNAQAGGPIGNAVAYTVGVGASLPSGAIQNYYFFADSGGDNVCLVIESTAAVYKHLGWGPSLVKAGAWTGGPYFFGSSSGYYSNYVSTAFGNTTTSGCPGCDCDGVSCQNCFIRADVDTFTGKWLGISASTTAPQGYTGKLAASSVASPPGASSPRTVGPRYSDSLSFSPSWQLNQTSSVDGRANLLPIHLYAFRDTGAVSLLGWIPYIFCSNGVGIGFSNASDYVLGSTTYKMFPFFAVVKQ